MLTLADKDRRGVRQMLTLADKGGIGGLANAEFTDKKVVKWVKIYFPF